MLLSELLSINSQLNENTLNQLRDLGLGRLINSFRQSFSLNGRGSNTRLTKAQIGAKILSRATGIGEKSKVTDLGRVRHWPHVRRELIRNYISPGVAAILFKLNEKPVAIVILGPSWQINNHRAVVGMSWDFTNTSISPERIQKVLSGLSISKSGDDKTIPLRMYQGHAQSIDQIIQFITDGVDVFGSRFDFSFISPEIEEESSQLKEDILEEATKYTDQVSWEAEAKKLGYKVKQLGGSPTTRDRIWFATKKQGGKDQQFGFFSEEDREGELS